MGYEIFAKSAPGPKYKDKGWDCQDFASKHETEGLQILVVADGHGSSDCFRSHAGAQNAVRAATEQAYEHCNPLAIGNEALVFNETGIANLKHSIWDTWKKLAKQDWDNRLLTGGKLGDGELRYKSVSEKYRERYNSQDESVKERYLYNAYGTTMLAAISTEKQLLLLQIGDGTCVVLQRDGEFRTPVPVDDANFLNVTTSLCEGDAHKKIRHAVIDRDEIESPTYPAAVFLSSDGVDDCFPVHRNEEHLYGLYANIVESAICNGIDATFEELERDTLPGLTKSGSQDDISLAVFLHGDLSVLKGAFDNIDEAYKRKLEPPEKAEPKAVPAAADAETAKTADGDDNESGDQAGPVEF